MNLYNPETDKMPLNLAFFDANKNKILELYSDYISIHISGVVRFTLRTINDNAPLNAIGEANYVQVIQHHGAMQSIVDYRVVGQVSFDNAFVTSEYDNRKLKDWNFSFLGEQWRKWSCMLPLIEITRPSRQSSDYLGFMHDMGAIKARKATYGGNTVVFDAYTEREARTQLYRHLFAFEEDENDNPMEKPPIEIAKMLFDGALIISK